ncbi:GNAT family N-acetyltransferase [Paenibacillus sp. FSL K6-1230]|uniref:GNAT family N-acetyltransferase n=1 Tax=Paenibacillus sp. FSL K6-1230 TaxID=2921603 RepID=UPI0030F58B25
MSLLEAYQIEQGELRLYRAERTQLPDILVLLRDAAEWMVSRQIEQWKPEMFTEEVIHDYFESREIYIAYLNEAPAGLYTLQFDDPTYWKDKNDPDYGYLHRLTVHSGLRGLNLGPRLLQSAERIVQQRGKKGLRLDCVAHNRKLNHFYQMQGFRLMGVSDMGTRFASLYQKSYARAESELDERIQLAFLQKEDIPVLLEWVRHQTEEEYVQWAGAAWAFPLTEEQLLAELEQANLPAESDRLLFKVMHAGNMVGHVGLFSIDRHHESARIGKVLIASPQDRGKGWGQQVIREALRIGFEGMNLHRMTLGVYDFNLRAIDVYTAAGFQREGIMRDQAKVGGRFWTLHEMGILRNEWQARSAAHWQT